jgi:hypothetical protein
MILVINLILGIGTIGGLLLLILIMMICYEHIRRAIKKSEVEKNLED